MQGRFYLNNFNFFHIFFIDFCYVILNLPIVDFFNYLEIKLFVYLSIYYIILFLETMQLHFFVLDVGAYTGDSYKHFLFYLFIHYHCTELHKNLLEIILIVLISIL